ncbi:MAG TPA: 3-deoxy-7-phosphoheptulonate synthase, partial [Gammaproteobacteria bacterium]|nr:3-deoxy-7-phosphoheptulonate synthase [Gammaproteobacteria bacterium]
MSAIDNINVALQELLATPATIKQKLPLSQRAEQSVLEGRRTVEAILDHRDPRIIVVVGPCSIHDVDAAMEYAQKLKKLSDSVQDTLYLVMRVYFEKPRTSTGWKGLINDPDMDDSFHLEKGLTLARKLLLDVVELGLPTGTEALDPIMPQYISDLISWTAIGARTTESQTHREMSSGLSTPVGFKNGTDGSVDVAINAMKSASSPHHFLGINQQGQCSVFRTKGNPYGHVVLRGGGAKTNYDAESIADCEQVLRQAGLAERIVVDCSHANSNKQ